MRTETETGHICARTVHVLQESLLEEEPTAQPAQREEELAAEMSRHRVRLPAHPHPVQYY